MKKLLTALTFVAVTLFQAHAVPAYPYPVTVTQPDGTTLTLLGHGDEFYNYTTTHDGYTLLKNESGCYVYALKREGTLQPSNVVAHDPSQRDAGEVNFLQTVSKRLIDEPQVAAAKRAKKVEFSSSSPQGISNNYMNYRGLIILINYTDVQFSRSDAKDLYYHMFNDEGYTGYTNEDGSTNAYGKFTGSVCDYYRDNSNGIFQPQFDVVGPVNVNYKSTEGRNKAKNIFNAAVQAAHAEGVDWSKYDNDNNGVVDMVYFMVAGYGSNVTGNTSNLLWPHKSSLQLRVGGYWVTLYASSTEMCGSEGSGILDGIGTVCHEFTHVLGFPDLYDTNYETDGQSHHPGNWDIMAGGGYLNNSRTPAGYSAFEKYALGFVMPQRITGEGNFVLHPHGDTHESYMLPTHQAKEYFLLENRQKKSKWDAYLPGHGMLVVRVDSTESWENGVNTNPAHNHYVLLRAGGSTSGAMPSDPFPGTDNVVYLSNNTTANLKSWNGTPNEFVIYNIQEKDGLITFSTIKEYHVQTDVEDFEAMPVTAASGATDVEGNFSTWTFLKCNVATPSEGIGNGAHAVAMKKPSSITMTQMFEKDIYMVSAYLNNTTTTTAKFVLSYSTDSITWKTAFPSEVVMNSKSARTVYWLVDAPVGAYLRINQIAGATATKVYLDDLTIYHRGDPLFIIGDMNLDGRVNVSDVTELVNMILGIVEMEPLLGDVNGDGSVNVSDLTALINIILGIN